ncbi:MAG: caspase family protein [Treponema sp.]|nr:caspase family protein [Treponema sp.]
MKTKTIIRFTVLCLLMLALFPVFAQDIEVFPQLGHSSVNSVAFSSDGRWVLSGSFDNNVKLWDAVTGREIRTFVGHTEGVLSVAFSPDGGRVLSGSQDNTVKMWDVATGREIRTFTGHTGDVRSVAFSPDGRQILSGSDYSYSNSTVKLWDAATGQEIRTFGHTGSVYSVAFSPDGRQILSSSTDKTVKLWDAATGREIRTFAVHDGYGFAQSVAFSPDGRQFLSGSDKTVKMWDVATGREIRNFAGHTGDVESVAYSPDGRQFLSGSSDKTVKMWDVATGREIRNFAGHTGYVRSVAFSPDGRQMLSGSWDNTIRLWDAVTGREIRTFVRHIGSVKSVAFSPDTRQVLSGYHDSTIKLWDVATGRENRTITGHTGAVDSVAFSPDGRQFLSGSTDKTVKMWDVATGREIRTFTGHTGGVRSVAFSPDGRQVLSGCSFYTVKMWNVATGREIWTFKEPGDYANYAESVAFSPDGRQILSIFYGGRIRMWDAATGREIRAFSVGGAGSGDSVAFSPDGRQILTDYMNNIKMWDAATGREIRTFTGHTGAVYAVAFSSDGRQILSGSTDKTVKMWDAATGREIKTFTGHTGAVRSVAFSPDGKQVFSGSHDGTIRLWDTATGNEIAQFISFTDGEWIAITPEGYYNASPKGDQYLNIRIGNNVYGIDQYRQTFYKPALVALALSGDRNAYLAANKNSGSIQNASAAPPTVTILSPSSGTAASAARTSISVSVDGGSQSLQYVTVKVNGTIVARDMGVTPQGAKGLAPVARLAVLADGNVNKKQARFNLDIPLDPGDNTIEVLAFNGYSEGRALVEVSYRTTQNVLPNLYILSVGVSRYADSSIPSLKYAANDAKNITAAFKAQEGKCFGSVKSLIIADGADREPTSDNIRDGMDFLGNAGVNDVMVLFLSGHGGTDNRGNFFFLPGNTTFNQDGTPQRSRIIPNSDLQDVLAFPGKKLVFIDSCYSGGIAGKQVGGVDNEVLINSLMDNAPVIFTSSSKTEQSWEWDNARLGLFTHVLLQGLSGAADTNKDRNITIEELGEYVKKTVPGMKAGQNPYYLMPTGYRNFVIAEAR